VGGVELLADPAWPQFHEQVVEPAHDPGALVADVDVALGQQAHHLGVIGAHHLGVIGAHHGTQLGSSQGSDGDRERVVGVVLVRPSTAQHPDACCERGGHIGHALAGRHQLLRQQVAEPASALDRPRALPEQFGPRQQMGHLLAGRSHPGPGDLDLVAVDGNRCVRRLVRVDADDHGHQVFLLDSSG
jgi:hypothetical protein